MNRFEESIKRVEEALASIESIRESILKACRDVLLHTRRAIVFVHRGELEKSRLHLDKAGRLIAGLKKTAGESELIKYVIPVEAEYVEAHSLYLMVSESRIPGLDELGVDARSYLLGVLDAIGEARRVVYDLVKKGDLEKAESLLSMADGIFLSTSHLAVYDRVLPGLRRKLDASRIALDDMRRVVLEARA